MLTDPTPVGEGDAMCTAHTNRRKAKLSDPNCMAMGKSSI